MKFARVGFDIGLDKLFDYAVPPELAAFVQPGSRVKVRFAGRARTGIVAERAAQALVDEARVLPVEAVCDRGPLLTPALLELARWMSGYWVHPLGAVLSAMLPAGVREYSHALEDLAETLPGALEGGGQPPPPLTPEQEAALAALGPAVREGRFQPFLLYGVTGSGKTEVYLQAIAQCLSNGRQAVVLLPEISLTPQMQERFEARFPGNACLFHSRLTEKQRREHWARFASGRAGVAVGARSVIFAPARRLGLIVVDEEHERGYKQDDGFRYQARDAAVMRAKIEGVPVILGSATPSVESFSNALGGKYALLRLTRRVHNQPMPALTFVDMATERDVGFRGGVFSRVLADKVRHALEAGTQVLLFLNRRGYSTVCACPACDWTLTCEHCSVVMTYHKTRDRAYCHVCGYNAPLPAACPECGSKKTVLSGIGTQHVEAVCRRLFPAARIRRIDTDSMQPAGQFEHVYREVLDRRVDILVGTQMLAKGLHFPGLALAGIICADTALRIPDFRACELTMQTVLQVAGRVGREGAPGEVVVQTGSLDPALVQCLQQDDYEGFVRREIAVRQEAQYPPAWHFVRVLLLGRDEDSLRVRAQALHRKLEVLLRERHAGASVSEPVPAALARKRSLYRWHLLIRTRRVQAVARSLRALVGGARETRISVDVDPYTML